MTTTDPTRLNNLMLELHGDEAKVTQLEAKHLKARTLIEEARILRTDAQIQLDVANNAYHLAIKKFQLLDSVLAEFRFELEQKELASQKAKRKKVTKGKTTEQTMADVMACLEALPADQRAAVIELMEQQKETINDN